MTRMATFDRIGFVLRLLREKQGRAQTDVARASGLSVSALSKYESQTHVPTLANLDKVLRALGVDLAQLGAALDAANGRPPRDEAAGAARIAPAGDDWTPEERAAAETVVGSLRALPPERRRAFTDVLTALQCLSRDG